MSESSLPLLVVATRNAHKTSEIARMLEGLYEVADLTSYPSAPEVEETGHTFAENAVLKAVSASPAVPGIVLADDSGLCVDVLGGKPGVLSARYAGEHAGSAGNNQKLIAELARCGLPGPYTARFLCAMTLAKGGEVLGTFIGTVEGTVRTELRGEEGFGYDPLFVPGGYERTFAELPVDVKNGMSHRGRALAQAVEWLRFRTHELQSSLISAR